MVRHELRKGAPNVSRIQDDRIYSLLIYTSTCVFSDRVIPEVTGHLGAVCMLDLSGTIEYTLCEHISSLDLLSRIIVEQVMCIS